MNRSLLIERIKAASYPEMLKAQIISAVICHWPEGRQMPEISLGGILELSARIAGVPVAKLKGRNRKRIYVRARMLFCYYAHKNYQASYSLTAIGKVINKDHTTVLHATRVIDRLLSIEDPIAVSDVDNLDSLIRGGDIKQYAPQEIVKPEPGVYKLIYDRTRNIYFRTIKEAGMYLGIPSCESWRNLTLGDRANRYIRTNISRKRYKEIEVWSPGK